MECLSGWIETPVDHHYHHCSLIVASLHRVREGAKYDTDFTCLNRLPAQRDHVVWICLRVSRLGERPHHVSRFIVHVQPHLKTGNGHSGYGI